MSGRAAALVRDWTFVPSAPSALSRLSRLKSLTGLRPAPRSRAVRAITARDRWNGLFLYCPTGRLSDAQRFSLAALRRLDGGLLAVVACETPDALPADDLAMADAVYWKALAGFDFSAYALAVSEVAARSPGADLYLQNDSVLGPFGDVDAMLAGAPWALTGFMASAAIENHVQSYAFLLRGVDPARAAALAGVLSRRWAFDAWRDVVNLQETRFARVAARTMPVGSLWYSPAAGYEPGFRRAILRKLGVGPAPADLGATDPALGGGLALAQAGFPFVKRSLLGRNAGLQDRAALEGFLRAQGHPL